MAHVSLNVIHILTTQQLLESADDGMDADEWSGGKGPRASRRLFLLSWLRFSCGDEAHDARLITLSRNPELR